jgi:hypothetical protein
LIESITQNQYESLLEMLEARNRLSHEYKEEYFNDIHDKLPLYFSLMKEISIYLKTSEIDI